MRFCSNQATTPDKKHLYDIHPTVISVTVYTNIRVYPLEWERKKNKIREPSPAEKPRGRGGGHWGPLEKVGKQEKKLGDKADNFLRRKILGGRGGGHWGQLQVRGIKKKKPSANLLPNCLLLTYQRD